MTDEGQKPADQKSSDQSPPPQPPDGKGEEYLDQLAESQNEFSSEDIDQFLKINDPAFANQLGEIKSDSTLSLADAGIDLETAELHDEIERWRNSKGFGGTLYRIFPFVPRVSLAVKKIWFRILGFFRSFRMRLRDWAFFLATTGRKKAQASVVEFFGTVKGAIAGFFSDFGSLSLKLKLALVGILVMSVGAGAVLWLAWKGKLLPGDKELFLTDLGPHADEVLPIESGADFENFYDNVRSTPNLLLVQKIVVNIKASKNSSPNPMAALEIFVEGLNPDVVIEVKDRESFFRDLIQRTTEDFSFDELDIPEGKQRYLQVLLKELNRQLTTGELRNVRIKTMILKP